jgi:hypothetical protein
MPKKAGRLISGPSLPNPTTGDMLRDGWKAVGKVFVIAVIIDLVYQLIVFRWFYPGEALLVAAILALIPYLLIRGPVNRIARCK